MVSKKIFLNHLIGVFLKTLALLKRLSWVTGPLLSFTLLGSIIGLCFYIPRYGVHPIEPIFCVGFVYLVAMVISGGYHRYFAHKTFKAHPALKMFYLILGCAGLQQSALVWASDHRFHHRFIDTDLDPYNSKKGFWWSHIGWLLVEPHQSRQTLLQNVPDLAKDKWVMWQHKYWVWLSLPLTLGIPLLIGFWIGRPMGMFLWGVLLRIALTHQSTFTINSIAHYFGTQPYSDSNSSRDVWWLIPFLWGENYHNYHHSFPSDYRNGIHWYQWDPSKWLIWLFSKIGLAKSLQRVPTHQILKAKLAMDLKRVEIKIKTTAPEEKWASLYDQVLGTSQTLIKAAELYTRARQNYYAFKKSTTERSRDSLKAAQKNLREHKAALAATWAQWRRTLRFSF